MKNHDFSRSRPPAGQHPQKGITLFSKIEAARRATSTKRDNVKVNVNKVNVKVNVNKVNVKVNVNKVNDKVNDIYSIHSHYSHYKGGGRWPPPQKRCGGLTAAAPLLWFPL